MMADGFTSQPRALQEYTRTVSAGGVEVLPCIGEFVFVVAAAVEFRLVIGGKSFKLMQGDHIRVERFRDLELHNLSSTNAITIRLIVGFGEFDRRIINGTVTMVPGVLRADGLYHPDTRHELEMVLLPKQGSGVDVSAGDTVAQFDVSRTPPDSNAQIQGLAPDPRRGVLYALGRDAANSPEIAVYDPGAGTYSQLFPLFDGTANEFTGSAESVAYDPSSELFYIGQKTFGSGDSVQIYNRLGAKVGGFDFETVGGENEIEELCIGSNGSLYVLTDVRFLRMTTTGQILTVSQQRPASDGAIWAYQDEIWSDGGSGNPIIRYGLDLVQIGTAFTPFDPIDAGAHLWYWTFWAQDSGAFPSVVQTEPFDRDIPLLGVAREGACPGPGLLRKPDDIDSARSDADVTVVWDRGRAIASGEIIRLALDWYFRGSIAPSDYLDHVYGIEVLGTPLHDFATRSGLKLASPGRSFMAASIEDNLQIVMPARVRITVDADLDMG